MKFEDLLMQQSKEKQKRLDLEEEVELLQAELEGELKLSRILQYALDGPIPIPIPIPIHSCSCLSSLLPLKLQALLAEVAMVEEEIIWLERKVKELNLNLYQEKKQTREWELEQLRRVNPKREHRQRKKSLGRQRNRAKFMSYELQDYDVQKSRGIVRQRSTSLGSSMDAQSMFSSRPNDDVTAYSSSVQRSQNRMHSDTEMSTENPNKLSEDLMKCLIGIFLKLNQPLLDGEEGSALIPKHSISCMNSKSFIPKSTFNCTVPTFSFNINASTLDPYGILVDLDGTIRNAGPYKTFTQITRNSLDHTRISECSGAVRKLRALMQKLCLVNLNLLTYKQKLAFWINIYNACIMHAFLQHGLPSTQEKLLVLMNKAAINVGGIVLNALAIEHFILRHPSNSNYGPTDEKEMLLHHAYGLGFPEPNVTFALCRGSWSSPALRVYTAEDIVNELAIARLEYLEASVGVTNKKKIMVPKLLQSHIRDFADDMESLLEWIYSQLPQSGSLKRLIMECLNGETKSTRAKMIEIMPYVSEFRYLLPSSPDQTRKNKDADE